MNTLYRIRQLTLLAFDLVWFAIAVYIALSIRNTEFITPSTYLEHSVFLYIGLIWVCINYINGLYDFRGFASETPLPRRVIETATISLLSGIIFFYIYPNTTLQPKTVLFLTTLIGYMGVYTNRLWPHHFFRTADTFNMPLLFVGWNDDTAHMYNRLITHEQYGIRPTAIIHTTRIDGLTTNIDQYNYDTQRIRSVVSHHNIKYVVATPDVLKQSNITSELYQLLFWDVKIIDSISLFEHVTGSLPTSAFSEGWFLRHIGTSRRYMHQRWQRSIDILSAIIIGSTALVLLPFIAFGIKATSRGPIFLIQKRIGKNGVPFLLYKFRSMYSLSADGSAELHGFEFSKKGDVRITSFGAFLRRFRIDELPQAINLLRGEISLIGPRPERPEIVEELVKIMPYYPLRHVVKPGLTGWAVLHQNYTDTMETSLEKLRYDLYYIKNRSVLLDMSIILKTLRLLLRAMGQ